MYPSPPQQHHDDYSGLSISVTVDARTHFFSARPRVERQRLSITHGDARSTARQSAHPTAPDARSAACPYVKSGSVLAFHVLVALRQLAH
jgi:hypothetical protein